MSFDKIVSDTFLVMISLICSSVSDTISSAQTEFTKVDHFEFFLLFIVVEYRQIQ